MKTVRARAATGFFDVVAGTPRSQAATMVLKPGQATGGSKPASGMKFAIRARNRSSP